MYDITLGLCFLSLVFDSGFRIYVKNCHIFDLLECTEVLCASSCDHFIAEKDFWYQCHILRFWTKQDCIPYVAFC